MTGFKVVVGALIVGVVSFLIGRQSATPDAAPPKPLGAISAIWDGGVLLKSDLDSYFAGVASSARADLTAQSELKASLARHALLAWAARERGFDRAPGVQRQCDEAMIEALRSAQRDSAPPVSEGDLRAAYEAELSRYKQEGGVVVAHILIRADGDGARKAAALLKDLTAKTPKDFYAFADAAHAHSIDGASKVAGGELPLMSEAQLKEAFGADFPPQLESLQPGALFPRVVSSPRGLHVIRFLERVPPSTTPFERVRETISARLRAERSAKSWTEYTKQLELDTGFKLVNP